MRHGGQTPVATGRPSAERVPDPTPRAPTTTRQPRLCRRQPQPHTMTPQRREDEVLLQAGRLAAEYLVSIGELPPYALQGRPPAAPPLRLPALPFQGSQHQHQQQQQQQPALEHQFQGYQHRHQQFQAPAGPSQPSRIAPRRRIAKRPVARAAFLQRRGRFPPPGAAAPETAAGEPGAGGVGPGGVRDGFDVAGPSSSSRQPSQQPGGAAHGQPEKDQPPPGPGEHPNSGLWRLWSIVGN